MMAASTSSISTGCRVTVAARSGRLQISRMPCSLADLAVLLQVPARLPHEPHRPHIGGPAPAGIQKTAGHWSHAHGCSVLSSQKNTRKSFGLCFAAHWRPLTKYGLAHASLSMVRGVMTETDNDALRRISGARVHDVGVNASFRAEKLLVTAGGGHATCSSETPRPRSSRAFLGSRIVDRASRCGSLGGAPIP